ncbi:zinc finger C2HC domain-containing protein 1C-like [Stegodyphus dumicola]|uniref:zinc finger C2HC domain-containing protein 1C-like n=1 Tax=Stegodyphus dumicola TaxID=202533 RepID=UPI0015AE3F08|nr:zinc finger C2HC domain-containing protein 1C-like [Stegodyphus dumicola]
MPSKLEQLQLQFRQRLMQEKEERMIKIHTDNQQKALTKVSKYNGAVNGQSAISVPKLQTTITPPQTHHSPIKKGSPGVDRSRPLPPISNDQRANSSNRVSPLSAPHENTAKPVATNSRSKSVDLESRQSPPRSFQNSRVQPRNGYSKQSEAEFKQSSQQLEPEKKPDPDLLTRLKQAELQRLKANAKIREDTPPRNGYTGTITKSSTEQKKQPNQPPVSYTTATKPRPKAQPTVATGRKPAPSSKPNTRTSQVGGSASGGEVGRKPPGPGQKQCQVCGRNFNEDRIEKHVSICKKASQKKVKVFDATKMRVKGTEAEQFVKKGLPKAEPKPKKSDWRKQHNEFIEAIRQAKMVQQHLAKGGKVSDLPPPPPSDTSHYVPCPHCGRKFSEGVAERHIPKCKNILSNKKGPVASRRK